MSTPYPSSLDFLVEEEEQDVPSSLEHLSRHELCHMIYRLDYERHTLKEKLVALRLAVSASNTAVGAASSGGGRCSGGAKQQTMPQLPLPDDGGDHLLAKEKAHSDNDGVEKAAKRQKTHTNDYDCLNLQKPEPTPFERNAIYNRLTQTILSEIKATTHGGLRKPKTTAQENNISLNTAMSMMQNWVEKLSHDTKRMIKWKFTSHDEIAKYLQCKETYLSGVRHNGKGFLVGNGVAVCLQYAKFELMVVSYDKLTMALKIQVTTRGCTANGK